MVLLEIVVMSSSMISRLMFILFVVVNVLLMNSSELLGRNGNMMSFVL